ncbi:MAG: AAA family ATPase [Synergistaceae bacterium]|jgi:DNA replication and repair protein RecF|nr:AAA family ATPase [Synergistaceae bacterium]
MFFSATYFHNFRNILPERREWSRGFNLITGPNGAGKTNFLEGLNLMSGWGPLEKNTKISTIVKWKGADREERASLWGRVSGEEEADIFASINVRCSLKFCDTVTDATAMRGRMPVMSWLSGHMSLIRGGASSRRALLDRVGALVSPSYAMRLHDYRRILRQKAVLLRRSRDARIANRAMIPLGSWIWTAREEILRLISGAMNEFADLLPCPLGLFYERGGGGLDGNPSADFKKSIEIRTSAEQAARVPLVGPQRDDVKITCGARSASDTLSRGQSRRAASALILASALVVERRLGRKPVLVFDELTSELDGDGKSLTAGALLETGCQVFATTTDPFLHDEIGIYKLYDGRFL